MLKLQLSPLIHQCTCLKSIQEKFTSIFYYCYHSLLNLMKITKTCFDRLVCLSVIWCVCVFIHWKSTIIDTPKCLCLGRLSHSQFSFTYPQLAVIICTLNCQLLNCLNKMALTWTNKAVEMGLIYHSKPYKVYNLQKKKCLN